MIPKHPLQLTFIFSASLLACIFATAPVHASQAVSPAFSPAAGTYTSAQPVTISTTTSGATIRYTTDGSTPSETNGTVYSGSVNISGSAMLKAIAYKSGLSDSSVAGGLYTITTSPAATVNVIYDFTSSNQGGFGPSDWLVQGTDGNFYGTTQEGGGATTPSGTVFKITPAGVATTLASFGSSNGAVPSGGLVLGSDGNFYGTTASGGGASAIGTVFQITPGGTLTSLVSFTGTNGIDPVAGLIQGSDGDFYGTTEYGGSNNEGTVFKITSAGVLTTLASFNGYNGAQPLAALVQGSDGNFYGTTNAGGSSGSSGAGTVFKMTPAGVLTTLVSFVGSNGALPIGGLVQASDGNFYGTTQAGGNGSDGTVFKITPAGDLTTLASFSGPNGSCPYAGLVQGSDGAFYGATSGGGSSSAGTLFRITPEGSLTTLASFDRANGRDSVAGLIQGSDGNFYSTTFGGGSADDGVLFQLVVPPVVAAPVFASAAGTYTSAQTVTITSTTSGAAIRYTSDGSTPTETNGTLYSGAITVGGTTTLKAIAYKANYIDSAVVTAAYTLNISTAVSAPTFSPGGGSYASAQSVAISSATGGATIRYTTDGSTPSETAGTVYSGAIAVGANATINAIAYKSGLTDSIVSAATYAIGVATPVFSPTGNTFASAQSVTLSTATSGASIAYTTDGSTPAESGGTVTHGTLYSGAISIGADTTLNAIAFKTGLTDSSLTSGVYDIQVAAPTISPAAGAYSGVQSVTMGTTTSGASIAYTTDGSTPTESGGIITNGMLYSGAISISANTSFNAIAFKTGLTDSAAGSASYFVTLPQAATPTFSPAAGSYTTAQSVAMSTTTGGVSIAYTTDGSTPTESGGTVTHGTLYSAPVSVGAGSTTLQAIAFGSGYADSAVATASYAVNTFPTITFVSGTQTVSISSSVSGGTIRYTTDGSTPTETNGTIYSGSFTISTSMVLKAVSYKAGFPDSPVTSVIYNIAGSPAVIVNVLYDFTSSNNGGINPEASLVQGSDGSFYGTAEGGGSSGDGTVFKITPAGVFTPLVSFSGTNGANPFAGLTLGSDGNFYGATYYGGSTYISPSNLGLGTIFKMTPAGALTTLLSFNGTNGEYPYASLAKGSDGNFYATTNPSVFNASSSNLGAVFKITPAGALTTLLSFNGSNGEFPFASLIQGSDGNFYGTTFVAGSNGYGTAFKLTPAGTLTTLVSFAGANGAVPVGGLVQGSDGNFYGTTGYGGSTFVSANSPGDGTAFKLTPSGTLTTLASFTGSNGANPISSLAQGSDGNFYGMANIGGDSAGDGTIFKLTPSGTLATLALFDSHNGSGPVGGLVQGSDGNFYGTTEDGGAFGDGVVFQLIVPPTAAAPVFSPAAGTFTSAQTVTITSSTSGASIRYTTDGSTPTETHGSLYSGAVSISATTTLSAIAYKSGSFDSTVTSGTYTITPPSTPAAATSGGGGGGAPSWWFLGALAFLATLRWKLQPKAQRENG